MMRMGVDLGGTKIELVALSDEGNELFRKRVTTPRDYQGTLAAVVDLVMEAEATLGEKGTVDLVRTRQHQISLELIVGLGREFAA